MEKSKKDSKTTINVRIDSSLKNEAEFVIDSLGLSTSTAIILFFKALVRERGLPFDVKMAQEKEEKEVLEPQKEEKPKKKARKKTVKKKKEEFTFLDAIDRL